MKYWNPHEGIQIMLIPAFLAKNDCQKCQCLGLLNIGLISSPKENQYGVRKNTSFLRHTPAHTITVVS
jgi:hypothetical protein